MVVLTRAARPDDELERSLREAGRDAGFRVCSVPTIQIVTCPLVLDLGRFDWIAFTSPNGVRSMLASYPRLPSHLRFVAIGSSTARPLKQKGYYVELILPRASGDALVEALFAMPLEGQSVLVPTSDRADCARWQKLRDAGATVQIEIAYRTECVQRHSPEQKRVLEAAKVIVFASPSAFHCLLATLGANGRSPQDTKALSLLRNTEIAAIGPTTRRAIEAAGLDVPIMPTEPSAAALAEAIIRRMTSP